MRRLGVRSPSAPPNTADPSDEEEQMIDSSFLLAFHLVTGAKSCPQGPPTLLSRKNFLLSPVSLFPYAGIDFKRRLGNYGSLDAPRFISNAVIFRLSKKRHISKSICKYTGLLGRKSRPVRLFWVPRENVFQIDSLDIIVRYKFRLLLTTQLFFEGKQHIAGETSVRRAQILHVIYKSSISRDDW